MHVRIALVCALIVCAAGSASAQFSGSIGFDLQTATNVQRLDTTSPDLIAMPALSLGYQFNPSATVQLPLSFSWAPGYYSQNTSLSYSALSLSFVPAIYLSNTTDIAREAVASGSSEAIVTEPTPKTVTPKAPAPSPKVPTTSITNDQLVEQAVTGIYSASVGLDSTTIIKRGLLQKQQEALADLRDSVSEAIATVADVLDSIGYSEEAVAVLLPEIESAVPAMKRLVGKSSPSVEPLITTLNNAIKEIQATHVAEPTQILDDGTAGEDDLNVDLSKEDLALLETSSQQAPAITLITSSARLRDFGASEAGIREDLADSTAKTLATLLTIPVNYYTHTGRTDTIVAATGNPNDSRILAIGAGLDLYASRSTAYRLSYDLTHSQYPYDSVYSNTENRFRLGTRIALGEWAALFGEAGLGLKNYTNPLTLIRQGPLKKVSQQVPSSFTQYSFGLGLAFFTSERVTLGVDAAVNSNPNLRAYVTDVGTTGAKKLRRAPQIADDEYTYDLTRGAAFATLRLPADIDAGLDLSYEHRTYGEAAKRQALNQLVAGAGRTENGTYAALTLSKIFAFETRAIGIFDGLGLEAEIDYANVQSSDALFTYSDLEALAGFTLSF